MAIDSRRSTCWGISIASYSFDEAKRLLYRECSREFGVRP
jgi:hypothetical protein